MAKNDILEHILEQAAIAASTALVELVAEVVESMLSSVIGRNERTSKRIDEVIDNISASLVDLISEKIRDSINLGNDDGQYEKHEELEANIEDDESELSISDRIANILSKGGMVQQELEREEKPEPDRGFRRNKASAKPAESIKDIAEKLKGLGSDKPGGFMKPRDNKRDHVAMKSLENIIRNRLKRR